MISLTFSIKSKRFWCGILLGLLSAALLITTEDPASPKWLVPLFFAAFTLLGSIKILSKKPVLQDALCGFWSLLFSGIMLFWTFTTLDLVNIWILPPKFIFLNLVFIFAFSNLLCCFIGKWKLSVNAAAVILFIVGIINSYVWQFRGRELLFPDINAAVTALGVVKEYVPRITFHMILGFLIWILVWFSQFTFSAPVRKKIFKHRFCHLLTAVLSLGVVMYGSWNAPLYARSTAGCRKNGFYVNFLLSIRDSNVRTPKGYSQQQIQALEEKYRTNSAENSDLPNIIVIMNESFADFRVFGENLNTNQPVMPYFDSLTENTIRGYAYSSVYGGQTANSEFEFLTGHSMGLLPHETTPYQMYIHENTYALGWFLQSLGYNTHATHPYLQNNWARPQVYPRLGFSKSTFMDDYPQSNYLRNWISDQEMYEYILQQVQQPDQLQPQFIFGITMQNHGGYSYEGENYTQTIFLEGYSQEYPRAEQYLSVINASDKALAYLISGLEQSEQKTVLLFFGDHFPQVEEELYEEIRGGSLDTPEDEMLKYQVPFLIWANYDIQEQTIPCTSLNFLSRHLLEAAKITLPEYYRFLAELESVIPAMNGKGYYSLSQEAFIPYDEAEGTEAEWLNKYESVQYNGLFDTKQRSNVFFSQYMSAAK